MQAPCSPIGQENRFSELAGVAMAKNANAINKRFISQTPFRRFVILKGAKSLATSYRTADSRARQASLSIFFPSMTKRSERRLLLRFQELPLWAKEA